MCLKTTDCLDDQLNGMFEIHLRKMYHWHLKYKAAFEQQKVQTGQSAARGHWTRSMLAITI
jgi:hypothetical protein